MKCRENFLKSFDQAVTIQILSKIQENIKKSNNLSEAYIKFYKRNFSIFLNGGLIVDPAKKNKKKTKKKKNPYPIMFFHLFQTTESYNINEVYQSPISTCKECPAQTWGDNCSRDCSTRCDDSKCHHVTGTCVCLSGFGGFFCKEGECTKLTIFFVFYTFWSVIPAKVDLHL